MAIQSINPATEEVLKSFEAYSPQEVERIVAQVFDAFTRWRKTSFAQRAALVRRAGAILRERKAQYGRLITLEMGKPIGEAEAEVEKCAWNCEFYA
ncbi:MAG TPA: aldehyde dehydrogenase family protein, partial [Dehalococcoidia bacterium]|nr:aldehyde dehydrogenase family protein [Dehalococcoidia bacterium]